MGAEPKTPSSKAGVMCSTHVPIFRCRLLYVPETGSHPVSSLIICGVRTCTGIEKPQLEARTIILQDLLPARA